MLRIEEIVGAMDDEFRYALDALSDERLAELAADKAALRRLRPVGVSHAEALAMIAAIQAGRAERRRHEEEAARRKAARAARRKAAPRRRKATRAPIAPSGLPIALPAPPPPLRLAAPTADGPAIRLPPPQVERPAIELPPPVAEAVPPPTAPPHPPRWILAAALAVAALAALVVATL